MSEEKELTADEKIAALRKKLEEEDRLKAELQKKEEHELALMQAAQKEKDYKTTDELYKATNEEPKPERIEAQVEFQNARVENSKAMEPTDGRKAPFHVRHPALTLQQELFCREYVKDGNATAAAIRAGYSPSTAAERGYFLMKKPEVAKHVNDLKDSMVEKIDINTAEIIKEMLLLATADIGDAYDEHSNLMAIRDIPPAIRRAITQIDVDETEDKDGNIKRKFRLKTVDKLKALETLGKHLNLFVQVHEHRGKITLEDLILNTDYKLKERKIDVLLSDYEVKDQGEGNGRDT